MRRKANGRKRGEELKTKAALLLLMLAMVQKNFAQKKENSKATSLETLQVELKASYTKSEVETILRIALEENEKSVERAFDEGYKQGLLEAAPDAAYYKSLSESLQKDCATLQSRLRFRVPLWSLPLCFLGGAVAGFGFSRIGK